MIFFFVCVCVSLFSLKMHKLPATKEYLGNTKEVSFHIFAAFCNNSMSCFVSSVKYVIATQRR